MLRVQASFDFFAVGELAAPTLTLIEATELVQEHFGLSVTLRSLGSQQDQNFLVELDGVVQAVLKVANPAFPAREIAAQDAAASAVARAWPQLRVATVLEQNGRACSATIATSQGPRTLRLLSFLDGGTLADCGYLSPPVVARFGELAARVSLALRDFVDPGIQRVLQWDLRHAERVVDQLAGAHPDPERRAAVMQATANASAVLRDLDQLLPRQAGHFDLTDDNVVAEAPHTNLADGLIDFGDVIESWAIGELAVTISSILHHPGARPDSVLPAVRAFHQLRPISEAEADALWPLVVLRGAVLVVSGEQQVRVDANNQYAASALDREWQIFESATSVPMGVMGALIRASIGLPTAPQPAPPLTPPGTQSAVWLDLGFASPHADNGAWLEPGLDDRAAVQALTSGHRVALAPYAVARITHAVPGSHESPASVPTGVTAWLAEGHCLTAPFDGAVSVTEGQVVLSGAQWHMVLRGDAQVTAAQVNAGDPLATASGRVEIQLLTRDAPDVPPTVSPEMAAGWLAFTADPTPLLGLLADVVTSSPPPLPESADALLQRRERVLAEVQEHYYAKPPRIERGWRHHLVDTHGRSYLDFVNNVASIGHAHPRLTEAVASQMARLNTNSRFHYSTAVDFAEELAAQLPDSLDTVFLVNSGSEATDLALRIAMAATARTDIMAVREAYHGWTYASDAVSTSVADNPDALLTRPAWVHTVDAPHAFRGLYRGADVSRYAKDAVQQLESLAAAGTPVAAFIAEAFYGNAGGIALPDGYLREVYAAVRAQGGVTIADEIQVGYGRLGHWFWGFEQQGVVPDVVAVAKSIGNGYPLGAVITSASIADRYRSQGYFFSSTGGSPVAGVVGHTVLSVIRDEHLQLNAAAMGDLLKSLLKELAQRHRILGAVHGAGLYLGAEFVRDPTTWEPATAETAAICDRLLELGVVMQPTGDHLNVLKIKPPLCVDETAVRQFIAALDLVLTTGW